MIYEVYEIGYDKSLETEETLVDIADNHCRSYDDRENYLPILTVEKAIKYLTDFGFVVTPFTEGKTIVRVSTGTDDDELNEWLDEHTDEIVITGMEDDYFWGKTTDGTDVPYHMEGRDIREVIKL